MLVTFDDQDLHLALVANSEYNFDVGETTGETKWTVNEIGLEQQIINRCHFHQHFFVSFLYKSVLCSFSLVTVWLSNFLAQKLLKKC